MENLVDDVDKNWAMVSEQLERVEEERRLGAQRSRDREQKTQQLEQGIASAVKDLTATTSQLRETQQSAIKSEMEGVLERAVGVLRMDNSLAIADFAKSVQDLQTLVKEKTEISVAQSTQSALLQLQVTELKTQLETKEEELARLNGKLKESEDNRQMLNNEISCRENEISELRKQLQTKMNQWFNKERDLLQRLANASVEVTTLQEKLQEKEQNHQKTYDVLKKTTEALEERMILDEQLTDEDITVPWSREHRPVAQLPGPEFIQVPRHSNQSPFEPNFDIRTIPDDVLRAKYTSLVKKFNDEIQSSQLDSANAKKLIEAYNSLMATNVSLSTSNTSLAAQLQRLSEIATKTSNENAISREQLNKITTEVEQHKEDKARSERRFQAVSETNNDLREQVKSLSLQVRYHEENGRASGGDLRRRRSRTGVVVDDVEQTNIVRDLTTENSKLKMENHKLSSEIEELKRRKTAGPRIDSSAQEGITSETDSATSPTPARPVARKRKPREDLADETIGVIEWKREADSLQQKITTIEAQHEFRITCLSQQLESANTHNSALMDNIKELQSTASKFQIEYRTLKGMFERQEESVQSERHINARTMRAMEEALGKIGKENESLKIELATLGTQLTYSNNAIESEKLAFADVQQRMIEMEREHIKEISKAEERIRQQYEEQIAQNSMPAAADDSGCVSKTEKGDSVAEFVEQLKTKATIIADLERRVQASSQPLVDDEIMAMKMQLAHAQKECAAKNAQIGLLESETNSWREKYEREKASLEETRTMLSAEMEDLLENKQSECDALKLELVKWKGQSEEYEARMNKALNEIKTARTRFNSQIQEMQEQCSKIEVENASLRNTVTVLTERSAEQQGKITFLTEREQELQKTVERTENALREWRNRQGDNSIDVEMCGVNIPATTTDREPILSTTTVQEAVDPDVVMIDNDPSFTPETDKQPNPSEHLIPDTAPVVDFSSGSASQTVENPSQEEDVVVENKEMPSIASKKEDTDPQQTTSPSTSVRPSVAGRSSLDVLLQLGRDSLSKQDGLPATRKTEPLIEVTKTEVTGGENQKETEVESQKRKTAPSPDPEASADRLEAPKRKWPPIVYDLKKRKDEQEDPKKKQR